MINKINQSFWYKKRLLKEAEQALPAQAGNFDMQSGSATGNVGSPNDPMGQNPPPPPRQGAPEQVPGSPQQPEDLSSDPEYPDMHDQEPDEGQDFETWKINYFKSSIKGDPSEQEQLLLKVRDLELDPGQRKFVEDNLQISFLRQHQDILIPSKKIRELIKKQLDHNLPASSTVDFMTSVLDTFPLVNNIFIKILGSSGSKHDLHRKFIAGLLGCVQISSDENLVFEEEEFSIRILTRFNAKFGDIQLGEWSLTENDPERILKEAELKRLSAGSPEEKDVLRKRIIMESISESFKEKAFIINSVTEDGTIIHLGLDLANCLRSAYIDGRLVVKHKDSDILTAFLDDDGNIIKIPDITILYVKEGESTDEGTDLEELEFISYKNGQLSLKAPLDLIKESSTTLKGFFFKETLFNGSKDDFLKLSRCVTSVPEMLLKQC